MVICLSIEYNGGYSGRWSSGCQILKCLTLNFILLSLSVKWYADMMSTYGNISTKPTAHVQSFHFDCMEHASSTSPHMRLADGDSLMCCTVRMLRLIADYFLYGDIGLFCRLTSIKKGHIPIQVFPVLDVYTNSFVVCNLKKDQKSHPGQKWICLWTS